MAFNHIGFVTIVSGQKLRLLYRFGGRDFGAQYCMANPLNPGGILKVNDQTKSKERDGSTTYMVTITCIGSFATNFDLSGGGLS